MAARSYGHRVVRRSDGTFRIEYRFKLNGVERRVHRITNRENAKRFQKRWGLEKKRA